MARGLCLALIQLLLQLHLGQAIVKWSRDPIVGKDTIHIPDKLVRTANHNDSQEYTNIAKKSDGYTMDEKCARGMGMSFGFIPYTTYIDIGVPSLSLEGIVPALVKKYLSHCCPRSNITHGQLFGTIYEIESHFGAQTKHDLVFPVYALQGKQTVAFKGHPVIPIVQAPKVVLLVRNSVFVEMDTRTKVLMKTIFNAWPMLIFIFVSACISGLLVWVLDRKKNSSEFPPSFFHGAWEGFWWAFVTMTTVGYGDRSPKSAFARAFCIIWILTGLIIISLFTGLVSAALSTSATPVFNIPGSKMGAVTGSQEFEFGVSMNADMTGYGSVPLLFQAVLEKKLQGIFVDNFILSGAARTQQMKQLRMYKEFLTPITYGLALGKNSSTVEACFRGYLNDYPQETFNAMAKHLKPFKSTGDDVSVEVQSAEKLFYEETIFKQIVFSELGILLLCIMAGVIWEYCIHNNATGKYRMILQRGGMRSEAVPDRNGKHQAYEIENAVPMLAPVPRVEDLLQEYDAFHLNWMHRMRLSRMATAECPKLNGGLPQPPQDASHL